MRVVLDANVLVSSVISTAGPPREIVTAWVDERFELVASPALLQELCDVLARPRFQRWVSGETATEFIDGLAEDAVIVDDPPAQPGLTADPDDDYLVALARAARADYLVSGDRHLLDLADPRGDEAAESTPEVIRSAHLDDLAALKSLLAQLFASDPWDDDREATRVVGLAISLFNRERFYGPRTPHRR